MLEYALLGSGSKANCYLFAGPEGALVVDNGLSFAQFITRCSSLGIEPARVKALLLTHTHGDHLKGVRTTCRKLQVPLLYSRTTPKKELFNLSGILELRALGPGICQPLAGFGIETFESSHDAVGSIGYSLTLGPLRVTILTDTGVITPRMRELAACSDVLFLEANHDVRMLNEGRYPQSVKRRIASERGHLSNDQAAALLGSISNEQSRRVYLCHISEENNSEKAILKALQEHGVCSSGIGICRQDALLSSSIVR